MKVITKPLFLNFAAPSLLKRRQENILFSCLWIVISIHCSSNIFLSAILKWTKHHWKQQWKGFVCLPILTENKASPKLYATLIDRNKIERSWRKQRKTRTAKPPDIWYRVQAVLKQYKVVPNIFFKGKHYNNYTHQTSTQITKNMI